MQYINMYRPITMHVYSINQVSHFCKTTVVFGQVPDFHVC